MSSFDSKAREIAIARGIPEFDERMSFLEDEIVCILGNLDEQMSSAENEKKVFTPKEVRQVVRETLRKMYPTLTLLPQ